MRRAFSLSAVLAVLVLALCSVPCGATIPVFDWSINGDTQNTNDAFVATFGKANVATALVPLRYSYNEGGESYNLTAIDLATSALVWSVNPQCNTYNALTALPHADAPDAVIAVVCDQSITAYNVTNGAFAWTVTIGSSLTLSSNSYNTPLPVIITPAGKSAFDRFMVTLYPQNGEGLTLLGIVNPTTQSLESAEVPCFTSVNAIHRAEGTNNVAVVCAAGQYNTGPTTLKAFSIADGRLDELWAFQRGQYLLSTAAGGSSIFAIVFETGQFSNYTAFYSIDFDTGNATELRATSVNASVAPFFVQDNAPTVSWGGEQLFGIQTGNGFATAEVRGNDLVFTSNRRIPESSYDTFGLAIGVPSPLNQYVVLKTTQQANNGRFTVVCAKTGAQLGEITVSAYNSYQQTNVQFDFCPDTKHVVFWGYNVAFGYVVEPTTGAIVTTFTTQQAVNQISVTGKHAAVGTQNSNAFGFENVPGTSWVVNTVSSAQINTVDGATFIVQPDAVVAYGSRGQLLWRTTLASVPSSVTGPYVLGNYVAVFNAELLIALDQYTGRIAYTRSMQPSNGTAPSTCTGTYDATGASFHLAYPRWRAQKSIFVNGAGSQSSLPSNGGLPCSYVVRGDATVVTVPITSISTVMAVANGDFLLLTATQLVRVDGLSGDVLWRHSFGVGNTQFSVGVGTHIVYLYGQSLRALSAANGVELWRNDEYTFQTAAGDDVFVNVNSYQTVVGMVQTLTAPNGTTYPSLRWNLTTYQSEYYFNNLLYVDGTLVTFGGTTEEGYTCNRCISGYDAETGDRLFYLRDGFGSCSSVQAVYDGKLVLASCDSFVVFDPHTGDQIFGAGGVGNGGSAIVSGDLLVQRLSSDVTAAVVPAAVLARVQARTFKPVPTIPPFTGHPSNVPTPETLPPAPPLSVAPETSVPFVAWTVNIPYNDYDSAITSATEPIDGVVLAATNSYFMIVDAHNGTRLFKGYSPNSCQDSQYNAPDVYTAGGLFMVNCGNQQIAGVNSTGEIVWLTDVPGGVSTSVNSGPFVTHDGDLLVISSGYNYQNVAAVLIHSNGVMVPFNYSVVPNGAHFGYSESHSFFTVLLNVVSVYNRTGGRVWNTTISQGDLAQYGSSVSVEDFVVVVGFTSGWTCQALLVSSAGVMRRIHIEQVAQYSTSSGYLVHGQGAVGKEHVYFVSTVSNTFYAVDLVAGKISWQYTNVDNSPMMAVGASPSCALLDQQVYINDETEYNMLCFDPRSAAVKVNVTYYNGGSYEQSNRVYGVEDGGDSVLIVTSRTLFNASMSTGKAGWFYKAPDYSAILAPPVLLDAGTAQSRVIMSDTESGSRVRCFFTANAPGSIALPLAAASNSLAFAVDNGTIYAISDTTLYAADAAGHILWTGGLTGEAPNPVSYGPVHSSLLLYRGRVVVLRTDGIDVYTMHGDREARFTLDGLNAVCAPGGFPSMGGYIVDDRLIVVVMDCVYFFSATLRLRAYKAPSSLAGAPQASGTKILLPLSSNVIIAVQPDGELQYAVPSRGTGSQAEFAITTAGSFAYSVNTNGEVTARYVPTGEIAWTADLSAYFQQYQDAVPAPAVLNETAIVVSSLYGPVAVDARLGVPSAERVLWAVVDPDLSSDAPIPALVSPYGVLVYSSGTFFIAVNISNGTMLWQNTDFSCGEVRLAGRYVIARCTEVVALDILTGAPVAQLGTTFQSTGAFAVVSPGSATEAAVVAVEETSPTTGDSVLQITPFLTPQEAPAPTAPVPTMPPETLPPGFTPPVETPTTRPSPFVYKRTAPQANANWSWPSQEVLNDAYSVHLIGQSSQQLIALVQSPITYNYDLHAFDIASKSTMWQQPLETQCQNDASDGYYPTAIFVDDVHVAIVCQEYVSFRKQTDGNVTQLVSTYSNLWTLHHTVQLGSPGFVCDAFHTSYYNYTTYEYVYDYGVVCHSIDLSWSVNCSSDNYGSHPHFVAYGPDVTMSCSTGEVVYVRSSDGTVLDRIPNANETIDVKWTPDGEFLVQASDTQYTYSQQQFAVFDAKTRTQVALHTVPGYRSINHLHIRRKAGSDSLWAIRVHDSNYSVDAFEVPYGPGDVSGTPATLVWTGVPFDSSITNNYNFEYFAGHTSGDYLMVSCSIAMVIYRIGTWEVVARLNFPIIVYVSSHFQVVPPEAPEVIVVGTARQTYLINVTTGETIVTAPVFKNTKQPLPVDGGAANAKACIVLPTTRSVNKGYMCILPQSVGWLEQAQAGPNTNYISTGTAVLGIQHNRVMVSTVQDLTALDPATGDVIYNRSLSSSAKGFPVLAGDVAVSFTTIAEAWISSTDTGDVIERVTIPLCGTVPSYGLASSAVVSGTNVFFTGAAGCLYHLSLTTRDVAVVDTTAGVNGSPLFATDGLLLWVTELNVLEAFDLAAQRRWAHELGAVRMFRRPQVYGNLVYVTSDIHTLHVLDKATGELVAVRSAFAVQLLGTLTAYNGEVWLPTTDSVVYFPADPKAAAAEPGMILTVTVSLSNARSYMNTEPLVSATGVLVYATAGGSAAVDTMAKRFLWNTSETLRTGGATSLRKRDLLVIDGDTVVGGLSSTVTARDIRTGAIVRSFGTLEPAVDLGFHVNNGKVYYATYSNSINGLDVGPVSRPPAASTSAAPNVADLATVPPATPAPDAAGAPSVGCVQRIATETAAFRACVSNTVIAPAYASRPAGSTFGCALAAQAMATCVSNYAALMPGCGQGVTFLQELVRGVNDSAAVPFCKRPATCASAAGSRDFCAALELPAWAKPSPIAGGPTLPPLPSYTTGAPSTAAPPTTTTTGTPVPTPPPTTTTTGTPVPTSQPPTNPPDTATVTGIPTGTTAVPISTTTSAPVPTTPAPPSGEPNALSATQTLTLKPGADVPSAEELAAQLRVALRLGYTPSIVLLGLQNGDTVLFAFEGRDAAANAVKFERVPAARLSNDLHGTRAGPLEGGSAPAPSKSGLPTWGVAIIAVLGVIALVSVAVIVVKRNAVCGKQADLAGIESGPGSELASGRIRTGGEYQRFEDAV